VRKSYKAGFYVRSCMMQHKSQSHQAGTITDRAPVWPVLVGCEFGSFSSRYGWRLEAVGMISGPGGEARSMPGNGRTISPSEVMTVED
jgi:hypothetical protein